MEVAISGAAHGVGLHLALEAAARGASRVWLLDIDAEAVQHAAEQVREKGVVAEAVVLDVSSSAGVSALGERWMAGAPDVVINGAGIRRVATLQDTTDDDWDVTLAVNLTGVFYLLRAAARALIHQGKPGVIVNIASVASEIGFTKRAAYCASKGGVMALTRAAALDLAKHDIRVITVSPGAHSVGINRDGATANVPKNVPLGREGDPGELAALVFDVARSSFVTGVNIIVDGGSIAGQVL